MQNYINSVTGVTGQAIIGATVTVLKSDGTVPTLYQANGSSPYASNVLTTDSTGEYSFYAANGTYTITIAAAGFTGQANTGVVLFDALDSGPIYAGALGAVPGTSDSGAALQAILSLYAGTGRTITLGGQTFTSSLPLTIDRCTLDLGGGTLKASGLGATTDFIIQTGSSASTPSRLMNGIIDVSNTGRDAIRWSSASGGMDFPVISGISVINTVRNGLNYLPVSAGAWCQNFRVSNFKILNSGGSGISLTVGNFSNTFCNQGIFDNVDIRGACQTTAGYDFVCDSQGSSAAQKISEITFISCDFDVAGAANHNQCSIFLNQSGSASGYDGWTFVNVTLEDTSFTKITGFPTAVQVSGSPPIHGFTWTGGVINQYGVVMAPASIIQGYVMCGSSNSTGATRNYYKRDMAGNGFASAKRYANDAAAATGGIGIGEEYIDTSSVLHVRFS